MQQRTPDFKGRRIERERSQLQQHFLLRQLHVIRTEQQSEDASVQNLHSLRLAR